MPIRNTEALARWLFTCCGMVFVMALIGAVTRLTESGLSITDWNPIMGAVPPLNAAAWDKAFSAYKEIPQYQVLHQGMTVDEFKGIFFWEWLHRLWGRLIGFVFALPFLWFLVQRRISVKLGLQLLGIFLVGGLQGGIGWFMVESGLTVRTTVSPYRLALHLFFALLIYVLMLWVGLGLEARDPARLAAPKAVRRSGWAVFTLLVITMVWGAFVAGLHAGEAYNTWPLMEGEVLPSAAFTIQPMIANFFENLALVQFVHRWLGPATFILMLCWILSRWQSASLRDRKWLKMLGGMAFLQVGLGISTLMSHAEILLATLHQAGAITLLTLMILNLWRARPASESRASVGAT